MTTAVSSLTSQTSTSTASATANTSATPPMNEQDFLKLLMAQMQNQDPLQPSDSTQWVTQLATYSQVEQSVAQTSSLTNISTQLQGLSATNTAALVGKSVTLQGGTFSWNGSSASASTVNLASSAQDVKVTITDSNGQTIRTMALGPQSGGALSVSWNGAENSGQMAPSGTYNFTVAATGANGQAIGVSNSITGIVTQVSYANGTSTLVLNNGTTAPVSQLASVNAAQATP